MYVIVVGCGRVGSELAMSLSKRGHDVTVIDHVGSSFSHLDPAWRGRTIEAEAMAEGGLKRAGVEKPLAEPVREVECSIVSVTRGGRATMPGAATTLRAGDLLHVGASLEGATVLRR